MAVGDRVALDGIDWADGRAAIERLEPRRNLLERPAVANVERIVVVAALQQPALDPLQLTRFLITAEAIGCGWSWCSPRPISVTRMRCATGATGDGLGLRAPGGLGCLRQRPGGAALPPADAGDHGLLRSFGGGQEQPAQRPAPDLELRVAAVSGRLQRGRHTTRHVELFALSEGVLLADTPGFNRPQLPADPERLASLFPELRQRLAAEPCRFRNCRHQGDPGCSLGVDWDRYALYGQCLAEAEAQAGAATPAGGERSERGSVRRRGNREELRLAEPLRRSSRRTRRQQDSLQGGEE